MPAPISHALVLPDRDFMDWYRAAESYTQAFERVVVVRSPAGNDLNRFRNVTAVQVPAVWMNDDALGHIRRIYPSVVRVDVIRVGRPPDLSAVLQERIRRNDRFGETVNNGAHLDDRMTLDWPAEQQPARITRRFDENVNGRKHEGIDIYALAGANVHSATPGTVATVVKSGSGGYGQYVQVIYSFRGQNHLITYANLQNISAQTGQVVKTGDVLAQSAGPTFKLIVQRPGSGLKGYNLPDVIDPTPLIYWDGLRLRSTVDGLRIRERPGTDFPAKGQVYEFDNLETMELHGRTLAKVGMEDNWLRVRTPTGIEGFAAAWYLVATGMEVPDSLNITGMNLDIRHNLGRPSPDRLQGMGWVRFGYDVSQGRGSVDFDLAHRLYGPYIERYAAGGLQPIVILGHQTYGEGVYNWHDMNTERWNRLIRDYANACREVARRYAGANVVGAYQIWNEQDTPPQFAHAAVAVPPDVYGRMLGEAIKAIRSVDKNVKIITGGHITGYVAGPNYARAALQAMPSGMRPDGIAFHAYGLGAPGSNIKYSGYGSIGPVVRNYSQIMDAPVWITEWGVLDLPNESPGDISKYASAFIKNLKNYYAEKVAAAVWYAWADTMHNGYGLVNAQDKPKQPFYENFLKL